MKRAIAFGVVMLLLLAACGPAGGASQGPAQSQTAAPSATTATTPGDSVPAGTWTGTVERTWRSTEQQSGDGTTSTIRQAYEATVVIQSTQTDIGAWTLGGTATIVASFSSDFVSDTDSTLGHCHEHFTDLVPSGQVDATVDGGLQLTDGAYEFYVNIAGGELTQTSVRDDSGCFGTKVTSAAPWSIGPATAGGSGNQTDPKSITGSSTEPDGTVVTWDLTLNN